MQNAVLNVSQTDLSPLLGAIGSFWFLVIVVLASAVVDWLKKRSASGEAPPTGTTTSGRTPVPMQAPAETTPRWEEELRRLLGVEPPTTATPPAKPPPIPPPIASRPRLVAPPKPVQATVAREPAPMASLEPGFAGARRVATIQMPGLRESSVAYEHAAHLQEQVEKQLTNVIPGTEHRASRTESTVPNAAVSEAVAVISLLSAPRTARQAIIASVILGAPQGVASEHFG